MNYVLKQNILFPYAESKTRHGYCGGLTVLVFPIFQFSFSLFIVFLVSPAMSTI